MTVSIRSAARRVLNFVVRLAPPRSKSWGEAMIREMDCVDDDAAALLWALGSTLALCRCSALERLRNWRERPAQEDLSRRPMSRIVSVLFGLGAAMTVLTISISVLATIRRAGWFDPGQARLAQLLFAVVVPDGLCLFGAVALWRPRRQLSSGTVAACAALGAHSIIYFVA